MKISGERGEDRRFVGAALCGWVRGRHISRVGLWDCLPRRETLKRLELFVSYALTGLNVHCTFALFQDKKKKMFFIKNVAPPGLVVLL